MIKIMFQTRSEKISNKVLDEILVQNSYIDGALRKYSDTQKESAEFGDIAVALQVYNTTAAQLLKLCQDANPLDSVLQYQYTQTHNAYNALRDAFNGSGTPADENPYTRYYDKMLKDDKPVSNTVKPCCKQRKVKECTDAVNTCMQYADMLSNIYDEKYVKNPNFVTNTVAVKECETLYTLIKEYQEGARQIIEYGKSILKS